MWFTKPEQSSRIIASIILKKEWFQTPAFYKREKVGDEWKLTENLWTVVEWQFKEIRTKAIGDDGELVEIVLLDDDWTELVVSWSWTQIMRNIANSLAGTVKEFKIEKIGIWLYEKAWKDGKLYPRVWVKNNWAQTAWAISIDEQNAMKTESEFKGKKLVDWSKLETALKDMFPMINGETMVAETEEEWLPF